MGIFLNRSFDDNAQREHKKIRMKSNIKRGKKGDCLCLQSVQDNERWRDGN